MLFCYSRRRCQCRAVVVCFFNFCFFVFRCCWRLCFYSPRSTGFEVAVFCRSPFKHFALYSYRYCQYLICCDFYSLRLCIERMVGNTISLFDFSFLNSTIYYSTRKFRFNFSQWLIFDVVCLRFCVRPTIRICFDACLSSDDVFFSINKSQIFELNSWKMVQAKIFTRHLHTYQSYANVDDENKKRT